MAHETAICCYPHNSPEIPALLGSQFNSTHYVQMLCAQQNCFSHFRKNITRLHAGLLRIGQIFSFSSKTVYRRFMTIDISCAKCF